MKVKKKYQFYIVKKVFPASIKIYTMHKYHYYSECFQSLKWVEWVWRNQRLRLQPRWQSMWSGREGPWMWSQFCGLLHSTVSRPKVLKSGWWTNGVCMNIFPLISFDQLIDIFNFLLNPPAFKLDRFFCVFCVAMIFTNVMVKCRK